MPVRMTSMPPRAIISTIWKAVARIAISPKMMMSRAPSPPVAGFVVRASRVAMLFPKHAESVPTSQFSAPSRIQTENESNADTSNPTIVTPAPATTIRVSRLLTVSLPGSARCSHAIRTPPMMTDTTAAAPMYHHSDDCRNRTVPPAPCGPLGRSPVTSAVAPLMRNIAPSTIPSRPAAWNPSPFRIRVAISAPRRMIEMAATTIAIHVTHPST